MQPARPLKKNALKKRTPDWIVTFADLATLLLTFFILLLSFAEMDIEKYRAMANSMSLAFGSSNVVAEDIGGTPLTLIEADTVSLPEPSENLQDQPEFIDERTERSETRQIPGGVLDLAGRLIQELEAEVAADTLHVNYDEDQVVIRFSEEATFRSGDAAIMPGMIPIIERVVEVLASCTGDVVVSGHTDDVPISSGMYRSNWDLSAARAVSVVHELVLDRQIPADRVVAAGRAETRPLMPNDSAENRAINRRVEIAVRNPECDAAVPTRDLPVEILP
ncbi:MAG: OmpA family protein [Marinobacter sp.]|uniref:flagellar motor protein MotB n=1 Tax=Marinobacter sp. TaxID=50741 RepID=UPI0029C3CC25|nr:flagellar motor protein MotB [Marinobacter sp.]MDX5439776.1 OmpA family protein [Alteromonadaceae bacterium]MDX5328262.1 OmpA family protein [Marinobacter sp.]MDX5337338.1 OmpA family protein [Marinobacter sp.]MDX5388654.1 OmpA family protein [Marinobacter sp.]MDX5473852.1 OmpA family protein [Marinobacter sp.]